MPHEPRGVPPTETSIAAVVQLIPFHLSSGTLVPFSRRNKFSSEPRLRTSIPGVFLAMLLW